MLTINPIDASASERKSLDGQTSSGSGKTFALAPLRISSLLCRLYDLCICTGTNFKLNAVRQCHSFSTSPFFCMNDPSGISGMGRPSLSEDEDAWLLTKCESLDAGDLSALGDALTLADSSSDSPERAQARSVVLAAMRERIEELLIPTYFNGQPTPGFGLQELSESQFREIAANGQYGFINRQGVVVCSTECDVDVGWDRLYYRCTTNSPHSNSFCFVVRLAWELMTEGVCDPDRLFTGNIWVKVSTVLFHGQPFTYADRPWVPSTIGFEGCAQNVSGGSTLTLPQVDRESVHTLTSNAAALIHPNPPREEVILELMEKNKAALHGGYGRLSINLIHSLMHHPLRFCALIRTALSEGGNVNDASVVSAVNNFISDVTDSCSKSNDQVVIQFGNRVNDNADGLRALALDTWRQVEADIALMTSHAELGVPYFDTISLPQSLLGARVTQVPFNPVDDLLSYEGPALMETAANLFFVATKGDSLGTGGYANRTLMAFDANTYGGLFSEWVARGKNDPEQLGLLRGIMGGDCVFVFSGPSDQGKVSYPLRYTHRAQSFAKGGERGKPRATVHDFIGRLIMYKDKDDTVRVSSSVDRVLREAEFGISHLVAQHGLEDGIKLFLAHKDFKIIYYLVTPPSLQHRVVYYTEEILGPTFFSALSSVKAQDGRSVEFPALPTRFGFLGSSRVDINDVLLSKTDPFFEGDSAPAFESASSSLVTGSAQRYRSQNPSLFTPSLYTSWEKVKHSDYLSQIVKL